MPLMKKHGDEGKDHGDGRHDQRGPDLLHCHEHGLLRSPLADPEVAFDVLHVGDRVIDQKAQGQDQCEERDAVDRVAQQQVDQQRGAVANRHG